MISEDLMFSEVIDVAIQQSLKSRFGHAPILVGPMTVDPWFDLETQLQSSAN